MLKLIHVDMISFSYKNKDYSLSFYAKINFYGNDLIFHAKAKTIGLPYMQKSSYMD